MWSARSCWRPPGHRQVQRAPGQHRCGADQAAAGHVGSRGDRQEARHRPQQRLPPAGRVTEVAADLHPPIWKGPRGWPRPRQQGLIPCKTELLCDDRCPEGQDRGTLLRLHFLRLGPDQSIAVARQLHWEAAASAARKRRLFDLAQCGRGRGRAKASSLPAGLSRWPHRPLLRSGCPNIRWSSASRGGAGRNRVARHGPNDILPGPHVKEPSGGLCLATHPRSGQHSPDRGRRRSGGRTSFTLRRTD